MKNFQVKTKIYSGTDSLNYLTTLRGQKALIITDEIMVKLGTVSKIVHLLEQAGINSAVFAEVEPDPSLKIVAQAVKQMETVSPDLLIALGGGSSIDTAKAVNASYKQLREVAQPVLIAIPTTSGTGSEVTAYSVITDQEQERKVPLYSQELIPDVAILDPELVKTVPPAVTADTGMDALTQAIEAYVSSEASDFTNALAEKAIRVIFRYLVRAYRNGNDLAAREKMHNASCLAGIAFTNAFLGLNHSMAHTLGAKFHLSHGRANAIMLPYVIQYNAGNQGLREKKKYADIALMMGLYFSTVEEGVRTLIAAINKLNQDLNIPKSLQDAGIDESKFSSQLAEMSEAAFHDNCTSTNPRIPTISEIADVFRQAFSGQQE